MLTTIRFLQCRSNENRLVFKSNKSSKQFLTIKNLLFTLVSGLASVLIVVKALTEYITGSHLCESSGCVIAQSVTRTPHALDFLGFVFFQSVFWLSILGRKRSLARSLLYPTLQCALVAEATLFAVQFTILGQFCYYCLSIGLIVIILSLLTFDFLKILQGSILFCVPVVMLSLFSLPTSHPGLSAGTYAVLGTSNPKLRVTLIYSQSCLHCSGIIKQIGDCSNAEIRFNPVSPVSATNLPPKANRTGNHHPRATLDFMNATALHSVPVLVVESPEGLQIINGESNVSKYLADICESTGSIALQSSINSMFNEGVNR